MKAYILRTIDYQEHGKLVYFYTETGIQSAVARGVKKMQSPLRHLMQTGMYVEVDLSTGKLPTVKDASMIHYFEGIKTDLIKTTVVSVINELIYFNVSPDDNHAKLFAFIEKVLKVLNTTDHPKEILMLFELKFLYFLGYGIQYNQCSVCGIKTDLYLEIHSSMMVCANHKESSHQYLDEMAYAPLKILTYADILTYQPLAFSSEMYRQLDSVIEGLYETHLSARPRAKKILKTL